MPPTQSQIIANAPPPRNKPVELEAGLPAIDFKNRTIATEKLVKVLPIRSLMVVCGVMETDLNSLVRRYDAA